MKRFCYIILLIVSLLSSCTEDIDLEVENTVGTLCASGFLYSDCDSNLLYVSQTGVVSPKEISDALVRVYVNGKLSEEITHSYSKGFYKLTSIFHSGDRVKVEVEYKGKTLYRESVLPEMPKEVNASVTLVKNKTYYNTEQEEYETHDMFRIDVNFPDISSDDNYYRLYTFVDGYYTDIKTESRYVKDSAVIDGRMVYFDKTEFYSEKTVERCNIYQPYIKECPPLTDEEMSAENEFTSSLYNHYMTFNNSRFRGSDCNLTVYQRLNFGYENEYPPETCGLTYDDEEVPEYNYTQYVGIESVDFDTYYLLKTLNGFESGSFESKELTGSVKMRRNVTGGSGNIVFIARKVTKVVVYDHYKPSAEKSYILVK